MILYPAVDMMGGRVVSLVEGQPGTSRTEPLDPLAVCERWISEGAQWLHLVDLDAAFGKGDHRMLIERVMESRRCRTQVGGGIRSAEAAKWFLDRGAERVVVGTRAIEEPEWLAETAQAFPDRVVLAVDARNGRVLTRGWKHDTGHDAVDVVRRSAKLPLAGILFTSVGVEGKLQGVDRPGLERVRHATRLPLIASGGVTSYDDLKFLKRLGVDGVILGAALYTGKIRLREALNLEMEV